MPPSATVGLIYVFIIDLEETIVDRINSFLFLVLCGICQQEEKQNIDDLKGLSNTTWLELHLPMDWVQSQCAGQSAHLCSIQRKANKANKSVYKVHEDETCSVCSFWHHLLVEVTPS